MYKIRQRGIVMARVLYLLDGSSEIVFDDSESTLQRVIEEHLGRDCSELFQEILNDYKQPEEGDNYERIADEYYQMLLEIIEELDSILEMVTAPRINKRKLETALLKTRNNLNNNL